MAKAKSTYYCQQCGANSPKWIGRCPSCGQWNTYVEEVVAKTTESGLWKKTTGRNVRSAQPHLLEEIATGSEQRIVLPDQELNRVLGGGVVPGSLVLIGGEPGIGKSTLVLQVALQLKDLPVLYVSGEESEQQLKMRADRVGTKNNRFMVLTETSLDNIFAQIGSVKPA